MMNNEEIIEKVLKETHISDTTPVKETIRLALSIQGKQCMKEQEKLGFIILDLEKKLELQKAEFKEKIERMRKKKMWFKGHDGKIHYFIPFEEVDKIFSEEESGK